MKRDLELAKVFDTLAAGCRDGKMPLELALKAVDMVRDGLVLLVAKEAGAPRDLLVYAWDALHGRVGELEECPVHGAGPCPEEDEKPKKATPKKKGK